MQKSVCLIASLLFVLTVSGCDSDEAPSKTSEQNSTIKSIVGTLKKETTRGAKLVRKKCASCHYLDRNLRKVGPTLVGIYSRAPAIGGIPFDIWDEAALNQWLANPNQVKPGTTMAIPGIKSSEDRTAIIEYLKLI